MPSKDNNDNSNKEDKSLADTSDRGGPLGLIPAKPMKIQDTKFQVWEKLPDEHKYVATRPEDTPGIAAELYKTSLDPFEDGISSVQLIQAMGSDAIIDAAARVSYRQDMQEYDDDKIERLLTYMLDHKHGTPFEHTSLTFRVTACMPIIVQHLRHRVGVSPNLESHRYREPLFKFYVPKPRAQDPKNKQGSVVANYSIKEIVEITQLYSEMYAAATKAYKRLRELNVSRELARLVVPQGAYTQGYFTFNVRSLLHFLDLRDDSHAQWEIRQIARAYAALAQPLFPATFRVYEKIKAKQSKASKASKADK